MEGSTPPGSGSPLADCFLPSSCCNDFSLAPLRWLAQSEDTTLLMRTYRPNQTRRARGSVLSLPLLALSLLLLLSGCGKKEEAGKDSSKPMVVGFSQVGAESDWRVAETKSIKDEA